MERRPTRIRTTLPLSMVALTLIAPSALGWDPILEILRQSDQGAAEEQYIRG